MGGVGPSDKAHQQPLRKVFTLIIVWEIAQKRLNVYNIFDILYGKKVKI